MSHHQATRSERFSHRGALERKENDFGPCVGFMIHRKIQRTATCFDIFLIIQPNVFYNSDFDYLFKCLFLTFLHLVQRKI